MFDKRLMQMCPESKKYIAGNIVLQWLELCLNALMIGMIAYIVQTLYLAVSGTAAGANAAGTAFSMQKILLMGAVFILIIALRFAAVRAANRMSFLASRTVKKKMREMIYAKLLKLGTAYREQVTTAELVQESVEGVDQLESYFGLYVPQFFYAFIAPVTLFILFAAAGSWQTGLILLIFVPLIPGTIMMVQKIAKRILAKYWDQYAQLGSTFLENLQGMTTLKIYQADAFKNEQMNEESENFRRVTMKVLTMQLNSIIIMDLLAYGGAAFGIILATRALAAGRISMGVCLFMILLSADFFLPMRRLGSYFHIAMNGLAASDRIFTFLSLPEPPVKTESFPVQGGEIALKSVSFSYDGEREVLRHVSMKIPQGSYIGIVGESGSGKSTIASLIMGRHTAGGSIKVGRIPLSDCSQESLMRGITYVGNNSFFFKGTVRDNLYEYSEEKMWEALAACKMDDLLHSRDGLDTQLTENAQNLSGGQRQRLALARALLHDSPIYIFDEATSNVDVESEEILLEAIRALAGRKTVIMITHRLANVTQADRIYVMDNGKIAENGTHEDLMRWGGVYAGLWKTQQELENFGKEGGEQNA